MVTPNFLATEDTDKNMWPLLILARASARVVGPIAVAKAVRRGVD
jgi:hypothetical protein